MNNQELTQVLTKEISKRVQEHLSKVFKDISESYDEIDYDTLMKKYSVNIILDTNKKKTNPKKENKKCNICMAKKADGFQCTRRKKNGLDYCGKHIKKLKFGRIDDELRYSDKEKYIKTKKINIEGEYYLIDEYDLVYSCSKTHPLLLGKKVNDKLVRTSDFIKQNNNKGNINSEIKIEIV